MPKIETDINSSKKDVIFQKAAFLFKSKGYSATTMRDLAELVGVEAPSLYNHIGSKGEILQCICFKVADIFTSFINRTGNASDNNAKILENTIRFHISVMLNNFDEVYVANHEWKHLKEPYLTDFLNQRRNYEKRLISILETGIKADEFKSRNPYVSVLTILSAVRGLEFWQQHKKNISSQALENDMVNLLLNGIIK